jgi:hypothetical protein
MKSTKTFLSKQILQSIKLMGVGVAVVFLLAGCGKDDKSLGDQAKSVTDTVETRAGDARDAVTGKTEESRANVDARLSRELAEINAKIAEFETRWNQETVPEFRAANKARLESLRASYREANDRTADLKRSSDADWKTKKENTVASVENAKSKLAQALEREKFTDDMNRKLNKIQNKIESLKADAARGDADTKRKLDEDRRTLESKYTDLKADSIRFRRSSADKWDDFKDRFSKSFDDLSKNFRGLFD